MIFDGVSESVLVMLKSVLKVFWWVCDFNIRSESVLVILFVELFHFALEFYSNFENLFFSAQILIFFLRNFYFLRFFLKIFLKL